MGGAIMPSTHAGNDGPRSATARPPRSPVGRSALLVFLAAAASAAPVAGQTLFRDDCAPCHGPAGQGGIGPQLAGRSWDAGVFDKQVRNGGLVMPAFPVAQIPDAGLAELLAYVNGLARPAAAELLPSPPAGAPGASVFGSDCQACHGAEGRGGLAPGILNTSLLFPRFADQVRHGGGIMPAFGATQLSDAGVRQIYAYLHPPLARPDPGTVYPLPVVPDYPAASLFVLAGLAVLAQIASERRRRVRHQVAAEEAELRERFPGTGDAGPRVRAF
jgi:mono/diheme cytochrome c family protein